MTAKLKVGLQLSVGGLGDKSFNDSAYAGLQHAQKIHNLDIETATWKNLSQTIVNLERWAEKGFDLITAIGYLNADAVSEVAINYPNTRFALIDYPGEGDNVWSAIYREYEGDFVVGVLAALVTQTRIVGFMGGGITPIVRRIELGFGEGVQYIDPTLSVISDYVGEFDDEVKGRVLAETQYSMGADVIYQVAGRCGLGAIEAAKAFGRWIISTGGDHSDLAPGAVLTSRIKDVGRPIRDVIRAVVEDRFEGGTVKSYGFAEGGLRMAPIRREVAHIVTPEIQGQMQELQAQIISGRLQVKLDELERI